jgi:hypothetical protein
MSAETAALAIVERPDKVDALAVNRSPDVVLKEAQKAAKALAKVIEAKPKKIVFNGKTYLQFEDWQTLGRFYGVTALSRSTKYVEYGEGDFKVCGFEARADALLVSSDQVISSAEALCLNDEPNWARKPLFQLKSMAQTRACAKALRNVLAWVVVLAGYAPTPAEEIEGETGATTVQTPRRKSEAISTNGAVITIPQQKRMFAIAKEHGWSNDDLRSLLGKHGFEHSHEVTQTTYGTICGELEAQ